MKKNYHILGKEYHLENVDCFYDEISEIDFDKSISDQINRLDEDLFQLAFNNGNVIDIGWYPSFEKDGQFIIQLISNDDWDNPIVKCHAGWSKKELIDKLNSILGV